MKYLFIIISSIMFSCSTHSSGNEWNNANNINNTNNTNNINNSNNTNNINNSNNTNNINNSNNTNIIDSDGDGVPDSEDKCPGYNDNIDGDFDGAPDFCDPCPYDNPDDSDGDTICDSLDICEGGDDKIDTDNDGVPDYCDVCNGDEVSDTDGDGVVDCLDPCPLDNPDDTDGDTVCDSTDPCPLDNPDDTDGDSVCDSDDICPGFDDNLDLNNNSIPDDCEDTNPGTYIYSRIPLGGMSAGVGVAVSPDNSYVVVLEYVDVVHIYDIASGNFYDIDLSPGANQFIYLREIEFDPTGTYAIITGEYYNSSDSSKEGVVFKFDDSVWKANAPSTAGVITQYSSLGSSFVLDYTSVEFDIFGYDAVLLGHNSNSSNHIMYLMGFDPQNGTTTLIHAHNVGSDAVDMAKAKNNYGDPGLFIVGGPSGAFTAYYTEVTGTGVFTVGPGNSNIGNSNHTVSPPSAEYALAISSSGSAIYKFEAGSLNSYSEALRFSTRRVWNGAFQPNGKRALILGQYQNISGNEFGGILEFRDGHYSCNSPFSDCEVTEVPIPNFGSGEWIANSGTILADASWRSDCDGGVITGGNSSWVSPYAFIATFQLVGGVSCNW